MQEHWKVTLCTLALMISMAPVLASEGPFTIEKMLADPDVMPAVNACVKAHPPGNTVFVESILPMNHGMVRIVTADTGGRRMDCVAELRSGKVSERAPLIEAKGPLFVTAASQKQAPIDECFTTTPVKNGAVQQGWLLTQNGQCGAISWQGLDRQRR